MIKNKVYIERINEGITMECKSEIEDVVAAVIEEYHKYDVGISDIINSLCIHGLNIEEVVVVYAKVYKKIEGDKIIRIAEGEELILADYYNEWRLNHLTISDK